MRRQPQGHGPHLLRFDSEHDHLALVPRSHCPPRSGWHSREPAAQSCLWLGIGNYQPLSRKPRLIRPLINAAAMLPPPMNASFLILFIEILQKRVRARRLESLHSSARGLRASAPGSLSRVQARLLWRRSQDRDPKSAVPIRTSVHPRRWRTRNPHSFPSTVIEASSRRIQALERD